MAFRALMIAIGAGDGELPVMAVPCPGADWTFSRAPSAASRSAVLRARAHRDEVGVVTVPVVGQVNRRDPFCACRQMRAWVAWAYLAVSCSASRQQKYTAASVSWPIRSASTVTATGDLLADLGLPAALAPRPAGPRWR